MKRTVCLLFGVAAVLLAGCVCSVYPFYTEKDLVSDPALAGTWKEKDSTWIFKQEQVGKYELKIVRGEGKKDTTAEARLFQLNGRRFLDLYDPEFQDMDEVFPPHMPAHTVARVEEIGPRLLIRFMDLDKVAEYLADHPKAVRRHFVRPDSPSAKKPGVPVLTGDTGELQRFLIEVAAKDELWTDDASKFERAKP